MYLYEIFIIFSRIIEYRHIARKWKWLGLVLVICFVGPLSCNGVVKVVVVTVVLRVGTSDNAWRRS